MKRYSLGQLVGVAVIGSAVIAGLTLWYTYSAEPRIIYDQIETAWPAAPQMGATPTRFLQIQFQNIGKQPAHKFFLTIRSEESIRYYDFGPKLFGPDELKASLSEEGAVFSLSAERFAPHIKAFLRIWLSGSGVVHEPRFISEEFGKAEHVESVDQAVVPWYRRKENLISLALVLVYILSFAVIFKSGRLGVLIRLLRPQTKGLPPSLRERYHPAVARDLTPAVETIELRELVAANEIKKAVELAGKLYAKDRSRGDDYVDVLLMSPDQDHWRRAAAVLRETNSENAKQHLWLAYRSWSIGNLNLAIEIGEKGRKLAEASGDQILTNKLKNSLAYYYADLGDQTHSARARQYAAEAKNAREGEPGPLDTLGYVQIVFGTKEEEILEGVTMCEEARRTGDVPFYLYSKHIGKAQQRLQESGKTSQQGTTTRG